MTLNDQVASVWKHVLTFLSNCSSLPSIQASVDTNRLRTLVRTQSLSLFAELLDTTSLASVRREIVASLPLAFAELRSQIEAGQAPCIDGDLLPVDGLFKKQLWSSWHRLFSRLVGDLRTGTSLLSQLAASSSQIALLRAVLHALNVRSSEAGYQTIVDLGVLPELHKLIEVAHQTHGQDTDHHRLLLSCWSLLITITTTTLANAHQSSDKQLLVDPVFSIIETQLSSMAERFSRPADIEPFLPIAQLHDEKKAVLPGGGGSSSSKKRQERTAKPVSKAASRKMLRDSLSESPSESDTDSTTNATEATVKFSLSVKVLSLVIAMLRSSDEARKRFSSPAFLLAFLKIVAYGNSRVRLITCKIFELLLASGTSEQLTTVDSLIIENFGLFKEECKDAPPGSSFIFFVLRQAGLILTTPIFSRLNLSNQGMTHLGPFPLTRLYDSSASYGGLPALVRLIHCLSSFEHWNAAYTHALNRCLGRMALDYQRLLPAGSTDLQLSSPDWDRVFHMLGALATFGGFYHTLTAGAQIRFASDAAGLVLSRSGATINATRLDGAAHQTCDANEVSLLAELPLQYEFTRPVWSRSDNVDNLLSLIRLAVPAPNDAWSAVSPADLLATTVRSRALRVLYALLSFDEVSSAVAKNPDSLALLRQLASTPLNDEGSTLLLNEDKAALTTAELFRRFEPSMERFGHIALPTLHAGKSQFGFEILGRRFDLLPTKLGAHPIGEQNPATTAKKKQEKQQQQQTAVRSVVYLTPADEPTADKCVGRVVLIDGLGGIEERLQAILKHEPAAIIVLPSSREFLPEDEGENSFGSSNQNSFGSSNQSLFGSPQQSAMMGSSSFSQHSFGGGGGFGLSPAFGSTGQNAPPRGAAAFGAASSSAASSTPTGFKHTSSLSSFVVPNDGSDSASFTTKTSCPVFLLECLAIDANHLRILLGARRDYDSHAHYEHLLAAKLQTHDFSEELALRALRKTNWDLDAALNWLRQNKTWLEEQNELLSRLGPAGEQDASTQAVEKKQEGNDQRQALASLKSSWSAFFEDQQSLFGEQTRRSSSSVLASEVFDQSLASMPTIDLVSTLQKVNVDLEILFARHACQKLVASHRLDNGESHLELLHLSLSLPDVCSGATFVQTALRNRVGEQLVGKDGAALHSLICEDIDRLLTNPHTHTPEERYVQSAHPITEPSDAAVDISFPGSSSVEIIFDRRFDLQGAVLHITNRTQYQCSLRIYQPPVVVPGDSFTYQLHSNDDGGWGNSFGNFGYSSSSRTRGWGYAFKARPSNGLVKPVARLLKGDVDTALALLDICVRAHASKQASSSTCALPSGLVLRLLRVLPGAQTPQLAKQIMKRLIVIFGSWSTLVAVDDSVESAVRHDILEVLPVLEESYSELRDKLEAELSPSHLQVLLELCVSIRKAFLSVPLTEGSWHTLPSQLVRQWEFGRRGMFLPALPAPLKASGAPDKADANSDYFIDEHSLAQGTSGSFGINSFATSIDLSSGKWYYELRLHKLPDTPMPSPTMGIGFAETQSVRNASGFGGGGGGNQRMLLFNPLTMQGHSKRSASSRAQSVRAGDVISCLIDFDSNQVSFLLNGNATSFHLPLPSEDKSEWRPTLAFQGSPFTNSCLELNYGQRPFAHEPPAGYFAIADDRMHGFSKLARVAQSVEQTWHVYQHVSDGMPINDAVLANALDTEVSVATQAVEFEYVSGSSSTSSSALSAGPNAMFIDDETAFLTNSRNMHLLVQPVLHKDPFILRRITMRQPASSDYSGRYLFFVCDEQPDFELFRWTDDFTEEKFARFLSHATTGAAAAAGVARRSHEPVAFAVLTSATPTCTIELPAPARGRFVVVKFVGSLNASASAVELLRLECELPTHPLAGILSNDERNEQASQLREGLHSALAEETAWSRAQYAELVALVQRYCTRSGVAPLALDAILLTPSEDDLLPFKLLQKVPLLCLQARFSLIKLLNRLVTPLLHYIDLNEYTDRTASTAGSSSLQQRLSLAEIVRQLKDLFFLDTKKQVFDALMAIGLYKGSSSHRVSINRVMSMRARESGSRPGNDDSFETIFGQLFTQLRNVPYGTFRVSSSARPFSVELMGESSIDVGGPFREIVTDAVNDLMSGRTSLFCLCPNSRNDVGLNRDKYVVRSTARSPTQLAQFEFVGLLLGLALRSKFVLPFNLSSVFWKQVLQDSIDRSDIEAIDKLCVQGLDSLPSLSQTDFDRLFDSLSYVTALSDGQEVELVERGRQTRVTYQDRLSFGELLLNSRLTEATLQMKAVRKGLHQIIAPSMLALLDWRDLEQLVCGNPDIDVEALRRNTIYHGCSSGAAIVLWFWKALRSFDANQRQLFLRFVWGRTRLPLCDADWTSKFSLKLATHMAPNSLPHASTCFFSLDLPRYSSYAELRSKLLFSIVNCVAIDADFSSSSSLSVWL